MPVQPDPTHPKFLEGDDVLKPPTEVDDDVQGHLAAAVPDDSAPEDLAAAIPDEGDDVEGHRAAAAVPDEDEPEGLAAAVPDDGEDTGKSGVMSL
jgi:hypothetical protein